MTKKQMLLNIQAWAKEHSLILNPRTSPDYYINHVLTFGSCPCSKHRPNCPCPESVEDVRQTGHCLCKLFWKDEQTYYDQMGGKKSGIKQEDVGTD